MASARWGQWPVFNAADYRNGCGPVHARARARFLLMPIAYYKINIYVYENQNKTDVWVLFQTQAPANSHNKHTPMSCFSLINSHQTTKRALFISLTRPVGYKINRNPFKVLIAFKVQWICIKRGGCKDWSFQNKRGVEAPPTLPGRRDVDVLPWRKTTCREQFETCLPADRPGAARLKDSAKDYYLYYYHSVFILWTFFIYMITIIIIIIILAAIQTSF